MYLSDNELNEAITKGELIVDPPTEIGPTSIDLHLDSVDEAKIWDTKKFSGRNKTHGNPGLELRVAQCTYGEMAKEYHIAPPEDENSPVFRKGKQIVVKPGGFVLWQTKERVGTPEVDPKYICFIDGKSTRARTGLVVHLTAPTIHAGWSGNVTLEIANLGPLHILLQEDDVIAQIVVAKITSPPKESMKTFGSQTMGQTNVGGTR